MDAAGTVARSSALSYLHGDAPPEPRRGNARDAAALEALHLDAADALLRRHGRALSDCQVSRECAGLDAEDDAVLYVVQVGEGIDTYTLNEALTAPKRKPQSKKGNPNGLPFLLQVMVPEIGVEPTTFALRMRCSTN